MIERHGLSPSSIESIAGFTAGTVSTLVVHPLDIIKTRLQSTSAKSNIGALQAKEFLSQSTIFTCALPLLLLPRTRPPNMALDLSSALFHPFAFSIPF
jgi:hypothetical protein